VQTGNVEFIMMVYWLQQSGPQQAAFSINGLSAYTVTLRIPVPDSLKVSIWSADK